MMKPFSEEKTGLKTGYIKFLIVLFLILLPENILSQIPFKGFGKLNKVNVDSGFTKLYSFDFNNDEYSDLLLFNPLQKKYQIHKGSTGTEFKSSVKVSSPLEISNIEPVLNADNRIDHYAVTSRRQRSFSLIKFNQSGTISVKDKIKFDTYPENISVSNNKLENRHEYLISGNSFRGLSLVKHNNRILETTELFVDKIFQNAEFIDMNSDGADDIIAVDAINNQLHFIFRNSKGEFEDLRRLSFTEEIVSLSVFDINYDNYKDIIISTSSTIEILFGDAFSSFKKNTRVNTIYQADKIAIGDFNRDGFFDFNYFNRETGIIVTIFAIDFAKYNQELIHLRDKTITDLIPFFSKFIYGTAILSEKGEVNILSKVNSMSDSQTLALGISPEKLIAFDYLDNGITDLAFIDDDNNELKIILRDASGLPEKIYAINLYENYQNILVYNKSKTIKLFLLYTKGKRTVEVIEVDCNNFSFNRRFIYADGLIEDLAVKPDLNKDAIFYVLYSKKNKLMFQQFIKTAEKYETRISRSLTNNFIDAFFISLTYPTIGYYSIENGNALLNTAEIRRENMQQEKHYQLSKDYLSVHTITSFNNSNDDRSFYSLVLYLNQQKIFSNNTLTDDIYQFTPPKPLRITKKIHLFFGKYNSLFVYESENQLLNKLSFSNSGRVVELTEKLSEIVIDNYIIVNFDQRNEHIIFTNTNGTIEIKELP